MLKLVDRTLWYENFSILGDMKQLLLIGWGNVFNNEQEYLDRLESYQLDIHKTRKRWRNRLVHALYWSIECFIPEMPNKRNASYFAWKIRFEKYFTILNNEETILIWSSLWWIFLLKWLSENDFPKKISQLHLVAPVSSNDWLIDEVIWNFEFDFKNLKNLSQQCENIYIYHSTDDEVVPYAQTQTLMNYLPSAHLESFSDRGHFKQPAFPELLANIWVYKR